MEEKLMDIIREIGEYEDDVDMEAGNSIDEFLDDMGLDDLSMAIEEIYSVILDPMDLEGKTIGEICTMIREER